MPDEKLQQPQQRRRHLQRPRTRILVVVLASIVIFSGTLFFNGNMRRSLASFTPPLRPAVHGHDRSDKLDESNKLNESNDPNVDPNIDAAMTIATSEISITKKPGHGVRTYPQISNLPVSKLPTPPSNDDDATGRLIIIGDVHGHLGALEALLRKAKFSASRGDTVIFAGDMVNKGPDSAGVVALAMEIGAFAVRGNHEDRVLKAWERYESKHSQNFDDDGDHTDTDQVKEEEDRKETLSTSENITYKIFEEKKGDDKEERHVVSQLENNPDNEHETTMPKTAFYPDRDDTEKIQKSKKKERKARAADLATAKSLSPAHRTWLSDLPLILRIGDLGPPYGEVVVVHAGLVPGIPLESQDAEAVMNMRTLLAPRSRSLITVSDNDDQSQDESPSPSPKTSKKDKRKNKKKGKGKGKGKKDKGDKKYKQGQPMIPSASRDGIPWAKVWNSAQTSMASPITTVVYGHDAKSGVRMRDYTFGLDSGCGQDGTLTGVIFEIRSAKEHARDDEEWQKTGFDSDSDSDSDEEEEENQHTDTATATGKQKSRIRHRLVTVSCANV
ncbi:Metallo-dependent phosphatase [Xylaria sp. CBS 124048]|nr:Metallo-dependent phosphatase [Xylaria sp. CBS 124048]